MTEDPMDAKTAFALLLEAASEQFNVLKALIQGQIAIAQIGTPGSTERIATVRAEPCIQMALAKEFVFNAARCYRICEHAPNELDITAERRRAFLKSLRSIVPVRDVNEHGYDLKKGPRGKQTRPTIHTHRAGSFALDETSLMVLAPDRILMGPLNLSDIFANIEAMRQIAGFGALQH
jgi:hypothetical protein